jgi:hypothetical protein
VEWGGIDPSRSTPWRLLARRSSVFQRYLLISTSCRTLIGPDIMLRAGPRDAVRIVIDFRTEQRPADGGRTCRRAASGCVTRRRLCIRQKLSYAKCRAQAALWLSSFFEKALVKRVKRLIAMRTGTTRWTVSTSISQLIGADTKVPASSTRRPPDRNHHQFERPHRVNDSVESTQIAVAPDGSPAFTRDIGSQDVCHIGPKPASGTCTKKESRQT